MRWTNNFAYAIGLLTTDGNLSKDGRHLTFVSKDLDQIKNLMTVLKIKPKICRKQGGYNSNKKYYYIQFSNVKFYRFCNSIGLMKNKTKILGKIKIPDKYFSHFLRGCFDGDGYSYSYWDKRWKSSFMLYIGFISASYQHINWLKKSVKIFYKVKGVISQPKKGVFYLKYAKNSSLVLLKYLYFGRKIICLKRKRCKILQALSIISQQEAGVLKSVDRHA